MTDFTIEPFGRKRHGDFSCGNQALDRYFREQASQDMKRRTAMCFVAVANPDDAVAGYYTLSACHFDLSGLDEVWRRRLPRHAEVPAVRLGRLAVDLRFQGCKLGSGLLADAIRRAHASDIAAHLMVVDAKDETAAAFYRNHGFLSDPHQPLLLHQSLARLAEALALH